jgi:uncharacterized protein YodC (DUF2158 family)
MKRRKINILALCCAFSLCLLTIAPAPAWSAATVTVEILYMNHGPLRATISDVKKLLDHYQGKVNARWFDVDQNEGKAFEKEKGIRGHVPLLLLINGKKEFVVDGKTITFEGFPSGSGPFKEVEGNWSVADLQWLLDSLTR